MLLCFFCFFKKKKKNIRDPYTIYPTVKLYIKTTVLNMFYKGFVLWKQGIHQTTENCRVSLRKHAYIIFTPLNPTFI